MPHTLTSLSFPSLPCSIWCGAVLLSGLAPNFWLLVIARVFSGVGEASFQCVVPPFIDDIAPKVHGTRRPCLPLCVVIA
jgi:MFS family permease